jgi:hypothetical protein
MAEGFTEAMLCGQISTREKRKTDKLKSPKRLPPGTLT